MPHKLLSHTRDYTFEADLGFLTPSIEVTVPDPIGQIRRYAADEETMLRAAPRTGRRASVEQTRETAISAGPTEWSRLEYISPLPRSCIAHFRSLAPPRRTALLRCRPSRVHLGHTHADAGCAQRTRTRYPPPLSRWSTLYSQQNDRQERQHST